MFCFTSKTSSTTKQKPSCFLSIFYSKMSDILMHLSIFMLTTLLFIVVIKLLCCLPAQRGVKKGDFFWTLLFCMSLLAPFFSRIMAASTLFTAAAQCSADLPEKTKNWVIRATNFWCAKRSSKYKNSTKMYVKGLFIARKGRNFTKIINSIHISMAVN